MSSSSQHHHPHHLRGQTDSADLQVLGTRTKDDSMNSSSGVGADVDVDASHDSSDHHPDHASIDYQGLAAESAAAAQSAAAQSAAVAALGKRQQQQQQQQLHHHQQQQQQQHHQEQQQQHSLSNQAGTLASSAVPTSPSDYDTITGNTMSQALAHINNIKNPHRMKLSAEDVKLILYLIVEVKPFKYVGNRSLSQTKKWEIIQNKYYDLKFKEQNNTNFIVPTVRTLQRQLVAAIRKAEARRLKELANGINLHPHIIPGTLAEIDADDYYNFRHITVDSPQEEFEAALLELHELSDKIKQLKLENSNLVKGSFPPRQHKNARATASSSAVSAASAASAAAAVNKLLEEHGSSSHLIDSFSNSSQLEEVLAVLADQIENLRAESENSGDAKLQKACNVIESVFAHASNVLLTIKKDNELVKNQITRIIDDHFEKVERIKEEFSARQIELGRDVIELFKNEYESGVPSLISEKLASIKEMLD